MSTIQIGSSGASYSGTAEDLKALRDQFDRQHYLKFPKLLDPMLLDFLQRQIEQADFHERVHEGIGDNKELCMTSNTVSAALLFLVNDTRLFEVIQAVTQCDRIGCFQGRVYRVAAGNRHHDSWHNDIGEHRLVGMSINLSRDAYSGGVLQIRDRTSGEIVGEAPNVGSGDAIVFRLSEHLQHRITEIAGTISKTAFAGWFRSQPDFRAALKEQSGLGKKLSLPGSELSERDGLPIGPASKARSIDRSPSLR
jgi:hypothetical protein